MRPRIPVSRHLAYARGYLDLGMHRECAEELGRLPASVREELDVREAWIDLGMETKAWEQVVDDARVVCAQRPGGERAWIAQAYALRELERVPEARDVLLEAETYHGARCGVLHYNLACYYCLLGDQEEAEARLNRACELDPRWHDLALEDPDLRAMKSRLASQD